MLSFERFFPKELAFRLADRLTTLETELGTEFEKSGIKDPTVRNEIRLQRYETIIREEIKSIENTRR